MSDVRRGAGRGVRGRRGSPRALAAAALALAACTPSPEPPTGALDRRIIALMQCQECNAGQLEAVLAMGDSAVPGLARLLQFGPPDEFVARVRARLESLIVPGPNPQSPAPALIRSQLEDYRSVYRQRAALALGLIGGPPVRNALCAADAMVFARPLDGAAVDSAIARAQIQCQ